MGELQPENWFKLSFIFTYVVTFTSALFFHVDFSYSPCYFILAWKTTFRISGRADLLVTSSLTFYLSDNVLNLSFISEGCFAGYRICTGDFFLVWDLGVLAFSSEKAMAPPLQCSCLENPMDGGSWWAAVHGVTQSRTWLSDLAAAAAFSYHGFGHR